MESWRKYIQNGIGCVEDLEGKLDLNSDEKKQMLEITNRFPMLISSYYANLIDWSNSDDVLKKMIVPNLEEIYDVGVLDPSNEANNTVLNGLQHKYKNTALLLVTDDCFGYCRYCFRRRLKVNKGIIKDNANFEQAIEYVKKHKEIDNVLVSGGDPLILSNEKIDCILGRISKIPHIKNIRIGTRALVYLPQRISEGRGLIDILNKYNKPNKRLNIVTHFNHLKELDTPEASEAIKILVSSGIIVRNQSVLLKGINDNSNVLENLFNGLVQKGVMPYYLFQCRPIEKSNHFRVSLDDGLKIFEDAKEKLSGLAKTAKYMMSHESGKIEICGQIDDLMFLKYHQAKDFEEVWRFFVKRIPKNKDVYWFDDLES